MAEIIEQFPSALSQNESKFTSERNITGIIRSVVDAENGSFICRVVDGIYEFVINGYYFKMQVPDSQNVWASILIDSSNRLVRVNGGTELYDGTDFKGIYFTESSSASANPDNINPDYTQYTQYNLKLKENNEPYAPSFIKFNGNGISVDLPESSENKSYSIVTGPNGTLMARDMTLNQMTIGEPTNSFVTSFWRDSSGLIQSAIRSELSLATSSAIGGIKIGYTTNNTNRNYAVQLSDGDGKAYVNVPWENTTYGVATTSTEGLMSAEDKTKLTNIAAGAEVNVQANWTETNNNSDAFIKNKPLPGSTATGVVSGNSSGGTATSYSRSDHVHKITGDTIKNALGYTPYDGQHNALNFAKISDVNNMLNQSALSASGGIKIENKVIKHTNSITATTTKKVYPITVDAQGHITGLGPGGYIDINGIRNNLWNRNQQFLDIAASNSAKGLTGGTLVNLNTPKTTAFRGTNFITGNPGWDGVKISVSGVYKIWGSLYFDSLSSEVTDYGIYVYYGDQELGGVLYPKPTGRTFSGALNFNAIIEEISPSDSKTLSVVARLRGTGGTGKIHLDSTMTEFYIERIA